MLKKVLIGVGVLLAGSWLWFGTDVGSYAMTAFRQGKAYCKKQVPIDFEIKRAKDMLANLDKVDDKLISAMAKEMVTIKHMEREVEEAERAVASQKDDIRNRNEQLKNFAVSKNGDAAKEAFAQDLERRFKRFRTLEVTVKTKKELLAQHHDRLNAAKDQRDGLKGQKADLASRIESLETQLALLKAAETRTKVRLDDGQLSELARVKELVDELEKRIDTSMTELQLREEIRASQPASAPAVFNHTGLAQEIDSYFGSKDSTVVAEK